MSIHNCIVCNAPIATAQAAGSGLCDGCHRNMDRKCTGQNTAPEQVTLNDFLWDSARLKKTITFSIGTDITDGVRTEVLVAAAQGANDVIYFLIDRKETRNA